MKTIKDIFDSHGVSPSVFKATMQKNLDDKITTIRFEVLQPYKPSPTSTDPVEIMVCRSYKEYYSSHDKKIIKQQDYKRDALDNIISHISSIFKKNSGLKSPEMSKNYKFIRKMNHVPEIGVLSLYRYLYQNLSDDEANKLIQDVHVKNFIAILDKMRQKYDK
jgi:hypothetical protein